MAEEKRTPLSFWGTVGAVTVSGLIWTGVSLITTFVLGGVFIRTAVREQVRESLQEPPPPNGGGA